MAALWMRVGGGGVGKREVGRCVQKMARNSQPGRRKSEYAILSDLKRKNVFFL